jgi:hypothetical protein
MRIPAARSRRRSTRQLTLLLASVLGLTATAPVVAGAADAATAPRSFSCTGTSGDLVPRTVTGQLTSANVPTQVSVRTGTGAVESTRARKAALVGSSRLHTGFTQWDITGANPDGNLYYLHTPPVLPGNGGFFDADLEVELAGGANGGLQISMFDCTVTGGPAGLSTPAGPRTFTCSGSLGEAFTRRTVTGQLTRQNQPLQVSVLNAGGAPESTRARRATSMGTSTLHTGYVQWDVTGANPDQNLYYLSTPPVLPAVGGYFDADLEITFGNGGGGWQIPMFDCTVA